MECGAEHHVRHRLKAVGEQAGGRPSGDGQDGPEHGRAGQKAQPDPQQAATQAGPGPERKQDAAKHQPRQHVRQGDQIAVGGLDPRHQVRIDLHQRDRRGHIGQSVDHRHSGVAQGLLERFDERCQAQLDEATVHGHPAGLVAQQRADFGVAQPQAGGPGGREQLAAGEAGHRPSDQAAHHLGVTQRQRPADRIGELRIEQLLDGRRLRQGSQQCHHPIGVGGHRLHPPGHHGQQGQHPGEDAGHRADDRPPRHCASSGGMHGDGDISPLRPARPAPATGLRARPAWPGLGRGPRRGR